MTAAVADGERPRSIGEVLDLLKDEFPDITISKIRFLEGQGLLDIERTPSGYRKFHDDDVARLRWILSQQREHFLPLRVIRERLARSGGEVPAPAEPAPAVDLTDPADAPQPVPEPAAVGARSEPAPAPPPAPARVAPPPTPAGPSAAPPTADRGNGTADVRRTAEELAAAAGIGMDLLAELERFGLVTGKRVAGAVEYDADALEVARAAGGFAGHGIEARHLRAYLTAASREAGLYEQLVLPLARQRTPAARRAAAARLDELVGLGASLRTALLRSALREHFGPV
ncbi:MAG: MerR family transcriptional regulator [Acidimicrobiales bacterium]|nr:MerR family transcriptional regulator [Acidimicrobiales bacterium]